MTRVVHAAWAEISVPRGVGVFALFIGMTPVNSPFDSPGIRRRRNCSEAPFLADEDGDFDTSEEKSRTDQKI